MGTVSVTAATSVNDAATQPCAVNGIRRRRRRMRTTKEDGKGSNKQVVFFELTIFWGYYSERVRRDQNKRLVSKEGRDIRIRTCLEMNK